MLESLSVRTFKSLEDVTVELGMVNVFIGANGSGKSNLLEALGVLSAAADGKVDDHSLLARGVRPGVPRLYKSAFPATRGVKIPSHISFGARAAQAKYEVSLHNPLKDPAPAWRFKTEYWEDADGRLVGRSPATRKKGNPDRGMAALEGGRCHPRRRPRSAEVATGLRHFFLDHSGLARSRAGDPTETTVGVVWGESSASDPGACSNNGDRMNTASGFVTMYLVSSIGRLLSVRGSAGRLPLSPAAASSDTVIRFRDRFMRKDRSLLSGYDASEGALYALFLAVVAGHEESPSLCAVDNADHGLNPRLARSLIEHLCGWYLSADKARQILLTTHNPLVLDGLPLQDDRVRLFTVSRTSSGRSAVRRVELQGLLKKAEQGWSLSRLWVMGHLGGVPDV